jgi:bifunctional aspartokinase / homoserine dehydrogenase 1
MKFGGTSVADASALTALRTAVAGTTGPRVIVVSALAGVTDLLVDVITQAEQGNLDGIAIRLQALLDRHLQIVRDLGLGAHPTLTSDLHAELTLVADLLRTPAGLVEGWRDAVLGTGELLSSHMVVAALWAVGLPAVWCDAREVMRTDARFGGAFPDR